MNKPNINQTWNDFEKACLEKSPYDLQIWKEIWLNHFSEDYDFKYIKNDNFFIPLKYKNSEASIIGDKDIVLVSMRKLVDGQQFQTTHKKPLIMCWFFTDGILYERLNNLAGNFALGGRKPRAGSTHDIELMSYIKQKKLKKLLF